MNGVVLLVGGLLLVAVIKLIIDRNWIGLLLCALDVEETDIDAKADEPIRPLNLMGAHILCQNSLPQFWK